MMRRLLGFLCLLGMSGWLAPRSATIAQTPSPTPQSAWIAVMSDFNGHEIHLVNMADGSTEALGDFVDALSHGPWWSADGTWFDVAVYENHNVKRLYRFNVVDDTITPLASFGWVAPTLDPAHERFALIGYNADGEDELQLWSIDDTLITAYGFDSGNPLWSPDGAWLIFIIDHQLHRMRPDGSDLAAITPPTLAVTHLVWSPDSAYIAMLGGDDGMFANLYVFDVAGELVLHMPIDPALVMMTDLAWTSDSQHILFVGGHYSARQIYRVALDGTAPVQLTATDGEKFLPQASPNGEFISYVAYTPLPDCDQTRQIQTWAKPAGGNGSGCIGRNLFIMAADGSSDPSQLTYDLDVFRYAWSPVASEEND